MKRNFFIPDVETGGKDPKQHPICQIAWQIVEPKKFALIAAYDTFVKPYNNLTIEAGALTYARMTMAQINAGVDVKVVFKALLEAVKKANPSGKRQTRPILVGHNIGFDRKFIAYLFSYFNKDIDDYFYETDWDTLTHAQHYEHGKIKSDEDSSYQLGNVCSRYGIDLKGAHGAPADVEATKQLFIKQSKTFRGTATAASNTGTEKIAARTDFHFEF